jgi:nuclear transcription factor Y, gamma
MVQAAAQAQAVVAAAKSRGDGLVPMSAAQIAALSQIQAQAIVHARKSGQGTTPQQVQTQIQLQCQALVHAHTQAQIAAGIYKGGDTPAASSAAAAPVPAAPGPAKKSSATSSTPASSASAATPVAATSTSSSNYHSSPKVTPNPVLPSSVPPPASAVSSSSALTMVDSSTGMIVPQAPAPSSSSPQFLAQLNDSLGKFWKDQLQVVQDYNSQTEQDFKTHNDLPLARIKRIMKSDEDVRMISAEAPVLFAKACELFILDLSIRSWNYSQLHKRRTLQKEDIREAIQKTDIFDFLVDVI